MATSPSAEEDEQLMNRTRHRVLHPPLKPEGLDEGLAMSARRHTLSGAVKPSTINGNSGGHAKLVVAMVGLPARGKTYLARKLAYYLNWVIVETKIFNLGVYRRRLLSPIVPSDFFDPDNAEAREQRRDLANKVMDDIIHFLEKEDGKVAIMDAANSSRDRRKLIYDRCTERNIQVFFVESVCDKDTQIEDNIRAVKLSLPEYETVPAEEAIADFQARIEFYRKTYTELDTKNDAYYSFLKLVNLGSHFLVNRPHSFMQMRITRFLMNLHVRPRAIYLTRHGESVFNQLLRIGGDSSLSENGREYAKRLKEFMDKEGPSNLTVCTSSLIRTIQTAEHFEQVESFKCLDELDAGDCDSLTYKEIKEQHPETYNAREKDKFFFRYPRGESYHDVVMRLEPLILELERLENVLVVCHQAVCRCLLAYFHTIPREKIAAELPYLEIPLHTVLKLTPTALGCTIETFPLGPKCVSTHIPKASIDVKADSAGTVVDKSMVPDC